VAELTVEEAARHLGVSPRRVRALLKDGGLTGRQHAGRWIVPSEQVERRQAAPPYSGRPLSASTAWRVLAVLANADDVISNLSSSARSRVRTRASQLRDSTPSEMERSWRAALGSRARAVEYYGHSDVLRPLLDDPRTVRSGISAACDHGADLMVTSGAEAYVRSSDLAQLQAAYALSPESEAHANIRLHVVESQDASWMFIRDVAPVAVVAIDLMDRIGSRDRAAGRALASAVAGSYS
jgi:excisionase family DNA binding protein